MCSEPPSLVESRGPSVCTGVRSTNLTKEADMSLLITIMLLSVLPFPILAAIELAEYFRKPAQQKVTAGTAVSSR
jgi:hypothetical protein